MNVAQKKAPSISQGPSRISSNPEADRKGSLTLNVQNRSENGAKYVVNLRDHPIRDAITLTFVRVVGVFDRRIRCLDSPETGVTLPEVLDVVRIDRMFGKSAIVILSLFVIKVRKRGYQVVVSSRPSCHSVVPVRKSGCRLR